MKAALVFLLLALFVAVCYADSDCNPDDNGMPNCVGNVGQKFRNNWDPTRYWVCNTAGVPEVVLCDIQGYDPISQQCVDWGVWQWYPVCP